MKHLASLGPYWKAVVAFLAPGAVLIGSYVVDGSDGGSAITGSEWISALVACVVAAAAVYTVPNKDPRGLHQEESVQPPEFGEHGQTNYVSAIIAVVCLLLLILIFARLY